MMEMNLNAMNLAETDDAGLADAAVRLAWSLIDLVCSLAVAAIDLVASLDGVVLGVVIVLVLLAARPIMHLLGRVIFFLVLAGVVVAFLS